MMSLKDYNKQERYNPLIPCVWVFLDRLGKLEKKYRLTCPAQNKKIKQNHE